MSQHQPQGLPGVKGMLTRLPRTNSLLPWMACGRRLREAELVLVPCAAAWGISSVLDSLKECCLCSNMQA